MSAVISMWSGPRNISTTMMRSFGNRADTSALDEPFYAVYLERSGAEHPYRADTMAKYPTKFGDVMSWIETARDNDLLFLKHIAYHIEEDADLSFIEGWRNFFLIRDPAEMVASFSNKFEDVSPIIASYRMEARMLDHLLARGFPCPVVDAADILKNPERTLRALCAALEIEFDHLMLAWLPGERTEDGPWAPHWYDAVWASTGFKPYVEKKPKLSSELAAIAEMAMPDYLQLREVRIGA